MIELVILEVVLIKYVIFDSKVVIQSFITIIEIIVINFYVLKQPDVSLDVGDGGPYVNGTPMNSSATCNKFHRSISMVQGWSGQTIANRYGYQPNENCGTKVIMRRKNTKMCDAG